MPFPYERHFYSSANTSRRSSICSNDDDEPPSPSDAGSSAGKSRLGRCPNCLKYCLFHECAGGGGEECELCSWYLPSSLRLPAILSPRYTEEKSWEAATRDAAAEAQRVSDVVEQNWDATTYEQRLALIHQIQLENSKADLKVRALTIKKPYVKPRRQDRPKAVFRPFQASSRADSEEAGGGGGGGGGGSGGGAGRSGGGGGGGVLPWIPARMEPPPPPPPPPPPEPEPVAAPPSPEPVLERPKSPWSLDKSIWAPRRFRSDAKSFYDTDPLLRCATVEAIEAAADRPRSAR